MIVKWRKVFHVVSEKKFDGWDWLREKSTERIERLLKLTKSIYLRKEIEGILKERESEEGV